VCSCRFQATNDDLKAQTDAVNHELEVTRLDMDDYITTQTNNILNLNNKISALKKALETEERSVITHETRKDNMMQLTCNRTLEYGQVCMATDNLYHRCRSKSFVNRPADADSLSQLEAVGNFVSDLGKIVKLWRIERRRNRAAGDTTKTGTGERTGARGGGSSLTKRAVASRAPPAGFGGLDGSMRGSVAGSEW